VFNISGVPLRVGSLWAFISGIRNSSVYRLKNTFKQLPSATLDLFFDLSDLTSTDNAYRVYREEYLACKPPCIPWMGCYLTQLTYVDDGNADDVEGMVNFHKRRVSTSAVCVGTYGCGRHVIVACKCSSVLYV
jgi:RasGEF domain